MRILFDQGTPAPLRHALIGHTIETAFELGWATLQNGELIAAAEEAGFGVFVTTDKNLKYQQNLEARSIYIVVGRWVATPLGKSRMTDPTKGALNHDCYVFRH